MNLLRSLLRFLLLGGMPLFSLTLQAQELQVPKWNPVDFVFTGPVGVTNPFQIRFSAKILKPNGTTFTIPGFYDGNHRWKVRVSANADGNWSLRTESEIPGLNGRSTNFTAMVGDNPKMHGGLKVDREHPHHFQFEDGTRFFLQGYECDWLWALDLEKPDVKTTETFLAHIGEYGFNYVILNAYAHDTSWRKGKTADDDFGPSPVYAWEGTNEKPDHSRMNLKYWQHYDRVIEAMHRQGIQAHIFIKVYNKMVNWPAKNSPEEDIYFRWLIARYAAYPNVIWDFSKESYNEKDKDYLKGKLRFIRETDGFHRLLTVHDDDVPYNRGDYDALLDFHTDQGHEKIHETVLKQRARKQWPVANVETAYEHGPGGMGDKTYNVVQTPEETLRQAWEVAMGGGYMAYYYTYTAWDVVRPRDTPPGYDYFKKFGDFWKGTQYWLLEPADKLVSEGWCLANEGKEYVVFLNKANPFTLEIDKSTVPLRATWFHPQSGKTEEALLLGNGTANLTPPADWGIEPLVLHVVEKE